jgi:hypothetical protein
MPALKSGMLAYCVLTTTVLGVFTITQAISNPSKASFQEIDVQRINVREPDGTLRMVVFSKAAAPGAPWRGKEIARPDRQSSAGILFMNDEGTENGGLIFDGAKKDGKVSSHGHLSFDPYEQDQVIALEHEQENGQSYASLQFNDLPDTPLRWDLDKSTPQGKAEIERLVKAGAFGYPRLSIGRRSDRSSGVTLADDKGRPRLYLNVTAEGVASIAFLDENGKPVRTLTADGK